MLFAPHDYKESSIDIDDREELRIRAALAALTGILSHEGGMANPKDHVAWGLDYADAFIEELERRG